MPMLQLLYSPGATLLPSRQLHPGPDQPLGARLQHGQLAARVLEQEAQVTGFIIYISTSYLHGLDNPDHPAVRQLHVDPVLSEVHRNNHVLAVNDDGSHLRYLVS